MEIQAEILTGAIAIGVGLVEIIKYLVIKLFSLITKKKNGYEKLNYDLLHTIGENHLGDILKSITEGNKEVVKAITDGNMKIVELLGRIEGKLSK